MSDYDYAGTAAHTRAEEERSMDDGDGRRGGVPEGYCADDDSPSLMTFEDWRDAYHADRWEDVMAHVSEECGDEMADMLCLEIKDLTAVTLIERVMVMRKKVEDKIREEYESFMSEHDLE